MSLKIGDLVEFGHYELFINWDDDALNYINLKGKLGILVKDISVSVKVHKATWVVYIQELGIERAFKRIEFKKVKL